MTATPIDVAGRDGGPVRMSPERLDELTARIEGRLLRPGDEGWDSSCWSGTPWRPGLQRSSFSLSPPATSP
jgi:hypothetical protein